MATSVAHELVLAGPYRLVRHPTCDGILGHLLGHLLGAALVSGRMHATKNVAAAREGCCRAPVERDG